MWKIFNGFFGADAVEQAPMSAVAHSFDVPGMAEPDVQTSAQIANVTQVIKSSDPQVIAVLGGTASASGFAVTPQSAMRVSAVYAGVRLLAGTLASIPISVYREVDGARESIQPELWWLLNEQPIGNWTAAAMWSWVMQSRMLRGDGYVEIVRSGAAIKGLRPHHPDRVSGKKHGDFLIYTVCDEEGRVYAVHQDDMLHFTGFGFNGTHSMSAIQWGAFQSIGVALAADTFSGNFFANGAAPKHVIKSGARMESEQVEQLRDEYKKRYAGVSNAGLPMVLTQGLDIQEMSMTAGDAQLLESRKFQVIDIARALGVPPHMIGAQETTTSWGSGVQQQTLGFIKFSMQHHLDVIRQELNRKLFRRASPFVEHRMESLLSGDSKAEGEYMRQCIGGSQGPGWMTVNEVRRIKNLPPVDGGDVLFRPDKPAPQAEKIKDENEKDSATDPEQRDADSASDPLGD
ncbi:phage portal protein [Massilia violaceinigra]|uniref:Phage portal protein n=1 Tax=Massilia violaceinigra TaxID=2045208 RepID=A0ABY4A8N6_9BURK|nr:phage portal protein [Massilia violaceinigra]UOD30712.1 phage portal protein [Massilia violaceinigra]